MSGVTFKCKQTGNTVTFRDAHDIDGLRKHPDYEEVFPQAEQVLSEEEQPQPKRMGRPPKKEH
jgi:hypothetical protein